MLFLLFFLCFSTANGHARHKRQVGILCALGSEGATKFAGSLIGDVRPSLKNNQPMLLTGIEETFGPIRIRDAQLYGAHTAYFTDELGVNCDKQWATLTLPVGLNDTTIVVNLIFGRRDNWSLRTKVRVFVKHLNMQLKLQLSLLKKAAKKPPKLLAADISLFEEPVVTIEGLEPLASLLGQGVTILLRNFPKKRILPIMGRVALREFAKYLAATPLPF